MKNKLFTTVKFTLFLILINFSNHSLFAKDIAFVSILPQKFLLESLAGDLLTINVLVKPGQSPEIFDPTPRQMAQLSSAKLYFTIGLPFEKIILDRIIANNMQLQLVETQQGIKKSPYQGDPHIWLDPILVKQQLKTIYQAVINQFPRHSVTIQERYQGILDKVNKLNSYLETTFSNKQNHNSFVIFHPALARFAKRYQLNQIAIESSEHHNSAKHLAQLMSDLKQQSVKYIIVEKQFSKKEAETIARVLNAQLIDIDPLAESWLDNMYDIAKQVRLALF